MQDIKVGTGVDVVFENQINKQNAYHMRALVYDYKNNKVIISQTTPPLNRHFLNRKVIISFLADSRKRLLRFGFTAQLIDLATDYKISADNVVEALILKQLEKPHEVDFRMFFRVRLPSQSNINLFFQKQRVNLIDISLGGAKFSFPLSHIFRHGDIVKFELVIDSTPFELEARIRNLSAPHDSASNNSIQYVGIEFEKDDRQLEGALGKALIGIQRQMLSEGKIV